MHRIVITTPTRTLHDLLGADDAACFLEALGSKWTATVDESGMINTGLYYAAREKFHEVYRLYDDQYGAFIASTMRGKTK